MTRPLRTRRRSERALRFVLSITVFAVITTSCGTAELEVVPAFDGTWDVVELISVGGPVDLTGQPIEIEIDTGQTAIRGRTNCQRLFGSYTFEADNEGVTVDQGPSDASDQGSGRASVTIPSPVANSNCSAADQLMHTELVNTLESITQWHRQESTLTLSVPSGPLVVLATQAG